MSETKNLLKSQKPHLGIFGRRNYGKSSIINALADQDVAIVSEQPGTTTDPVQKTMEITGFGPVVIIDTAGIDDVGDLGALRIGKTQEIIKQIDLAVLVLAHNQWDSFESELIQSFEKLNTPYFVVYNKSDIDELGPELRERIVSELKTDYVEFSAVDRRNYERLISLISTHMPSSVFNNPTILGDLVSHGDTVLLVTPIDVQAPKGRLILPQVQTIRDCLDNDCIAIVLKERELDIFWKNHDINPKLVVCDSQVFLKAAASIPERIPLTSFSILFARLKGDFESYLKGTPQISKLKDGDRVLIFESCSHHVSGDDIGRVKIPRWLKNYTGRELEFEVVAGLDQPELPIDKYGLLIQCGGCMLTRKQIANRIRPAVEAGVPVTNYGMTIAYCLGIYDRAIKPFVGETASSMDYL